MRGGICVKFFAAIFPANVRTKICEKKFSKISRRLFRQSFETDRPTVCGGERVTRAFLIISGNYGCAPRCGVIFAALTPN